MPVLHRHFYADRDAVGHMAQHPAQVQATSPGTMLASRAWISSSSIGQALFAGASQIWK